MDRPTRSLFGMTFYLTIGLLQAYYLYFISYRLLVGILFTQLIIGILVGIFQDYFHSRETIKGHVLFLCAQHAGIISVKTQEGILREGLGKLALMMVNEESESLRESRREHVFIDAISFNDDHHPCVNSAELSNVFHPSL